MLVIYAIDCTTSSDQVLFLVKMSIRLLCKQTAKRPSNALFYFRDEQKTGIAPTRIILDKQLEITVGMVVTVNWDGEKVEAEILALGGKYLCCHSKN